MPTSFAEQSPLHVAIIPDGNGRWASALGLPRSAGHRAGVDAVCRVVRAAPAHGIGALTLHALSLDNRRRPAPECDSILAFIRMFLELETQTCVREDVRITCLGARAGLPVELRRAIECAERSTAEGTRLHLRLAIDYSSRAAIRSALGTPPPRQDLAPDVDLLIRTGGEKRLSDFLLWECAYAELVFLDTRWPDFGEADLAAALVEFRRRERRFGGLPPAADLAGSSTGAATAASADSTTTTMPGPAGSTRS